MNSDFGCQATATNRCTPVSEVNRQAQAGRFDHQTSGGSVMSSRRGYFNFSEQEASRKNTTLLSGVPQRTSERTLRVWIAPFEDTAHNFHAASVVYTVLEKSHWAGMPAKEIHRQALAGDD